MAIQGHSRSRFGGRWTQYRYIYIGLVSNGFENIMTESTENWRCRPPTVVWRLLLWNPREYPRKAYISYIARNWTRYTFAEVSHQVFVVHWLRQTHVLCNRVWVRSGRWRSTKVVDFATNRKRVCDFLLVINGNLGPILHRFWNTAT